MCVFTHVWLSVETRRGVQISWRWSCKHVSAAWHERGAWTPALKTEQRTLWTLCHLPSLPRVSPASLKTHKLLLFFCPALRKSHSMFRKQFHFRVCETKAENQGLTGKLGQMCWLWVCCLSNVPQGRRHLSCLYVCISPWQGQLGAWQNCRPALGIPLIDGVSITTGLVALQTWMECSAVF